jgi:hypothetical protein
VEPPTKTISWTFDLSILESRKKRGVAKDLLNRFKGTAEEILAELFETGTSEGSVEIDTLKESRFQWMFG